VTAVSTDRTQQVTLYMQKCVIFGTINNGQILETKEYLIFF
jgi:hypothetical protein